MDPTNFQGNEITDIFSYLNSIDYKSEWWILCIGLFHLTITSLAYFIININFQIVLFMALLMVVYFSEFLNELAAQNSHRFARENFFDSNGLFLSVFVSCPILINCIFILTRWLHTSYELMTKVKTAQLKQEAKRRKKLAESNPSHQKIE